MAIFGKKLTTDPDAVRQVLQTLRDGLTAALGDELIAFIVYGDFVNPEQYRPDFSPVNIMLVAKQVDSATLDGISSVMRIAEQSLRLGTMILTPDDLKSSCDVFPVKFHDIQLRHRLLAGEDVLSELAISDDHLRLRCEQELKNLMLRQGLIYLRLSDKPDQLWQALTETATTFVRVLPACLTVKTGISPEADADMLDMFADEFKIDISPVTQILGLMDESKACPATESKGLFNRLMELVRGAANAMDQLDEQA